jgi:phosphonate transport system permease protein
MVLLLLWPMARLTEFDAGALLDPANRPALARFLGTFVPLSLSREFLELLLRSTVETLAIATAGMALALVVGGPLALVVSRSLSVSGLISRTGTALGWLVRWPTRLLLVVFRSIPELVWALLFVRAVGLGPAAGVLALGITYGGMLGKVYAEILESADNQPTRAVLLAGGGRLAALTYGLLPVTLPELVSYTVYRWECAIRASVIMGFVGAGGLGMQMELSLRMLEGGEVGVMLLVFLALVLLADSISALLRRVLS